MTSSNAVQAGRAERAVGRRHHLPAHLGGLALPRRRPRCVLPNDRRLGDDRAHAHRARRRRVADGRRCRRPEPGLIHHSDQGSQYVALGFGQQARDAGISVSMGSKGDAYDNAVAESFFATIKKELVHRQSWPSRRDLSSAVFEYIEAFYNRQEDTHARIPLPRGIREKENHNHEQMLATKAHNWPRNGSTPVLPRLRAPGLGRPALSSATAPPPEPTAGWPQT